MKGSPICPQDKGEKMKVQLSLPDQCHRDNEKVRTGIEASDFQVPRSFLEIVKYENPFHDHILEKSPTFLKK